MKWKVSCARQGLPPVGADYRGCSVRGWIPCLVSLKRTVVSPVFSIKVPDQQKRQESVLGCVGSSGSLGSSYRWHFLGQSCSLHSLGMVPCSSPHIQSPWGVATFHIGKQTGCWCRGCQGFRNWGWQQAGVPRLPWPLRREADP